ncbi:MAG: TIGR03960 family B12-binding radical SAM protein [Desulfobacterales bacterium]
MTEPSIQDVLAGIEQPSRYLGIETNAVHKDHSRVDLHTVLAFPDLYDIGTSHFGIQILYHLLNQRPDTVAERVFAPGVDMEARLRALGRPLTSLESGIPLRNFDIIGFSLLYELNYTNILTMLDLSNIAFLTAHRQEDEPLVIAGGPCTCNPEPVADFFDAMLIGDGEAAVIAMVEKWLAWKKDGRKSRQALMRQWSEIEGVYIPSFFKPIYDAKGLQRLEPKYTSYTRIKRAVVGNLDGAAFPSQPVVPFGRPIHDRLRLEVARGCTRGCRFCQAGMIYRPVRERSVQTLMNQTNCALRHTGYEDMSLLSLSTGDYNCIETLMQLLMDRCAGDHVAISLPSLRAGTLTPELMNLIKMVRKTGFTIAPEAGSQRLRNVINKNIDEAEIVETVENAFRLGWQVIKLYFMVGLPTETDDDLTAIFDLVQRLRRLKRPERRRGQINVSVATFIPKPHTPFQWVGQVPLEDAHQKIHRLRDKLNVPGVHFKWQPPDVSRIEGLWARGDRRLGKLLVTAYRLGCRLDGWSDHFQYNRWQSASEAAGVDIDFFTARTRDVTESLPWDTIDIGVSKEFLWQEARKALAGELTEDCRGGDCNSCGVCNFENLAPVVYDSCGPGSSQGRIGKNHSKSVGHQFLITFSKTGPIRFLGHLEMANIFVRALRRADVRLKYSEGFHPQPKLSFQDALPVGMESLQELLLVTVTGETTPDEIIRQLNVQLPDGLLVTDCRPLTSKFVRPEPVVTTYRLELDGDVFTDEKIASFLKKPEWIVSRTNRKGKVRKIDLRLAVSGIERISPSELNLRLRSLHGSMMRPGDVVDHLFAVPSEKLRHLRVTKISSHGDAASGKEKGFSHGTANLQASANSPCPRPERGAAKFD